MRLPNIVLVRKLIEEFASFSFSFHFKAVKHSQFDDTRYAVHIRNIPAFDSIHLTWQIVNYNSSRQ